MKLGAMDSYMTQISNRMNEIMKVLSIVATIMLPLGFLDGKALYLPGIGFV